MNNLVIPVVVTVKRFVFDSELSLLRELGMNEQEIKENMYRSAGIISRGNEKTGNLVRSAKFPFFPIPTIRESLASLRVSDVNKTCTC